MIYDITHYGAVSDGVTVCTAAIQAAIDDCAMQGGGRVLVPAGRFVTGTVYLKSHVELHLSQGAVLKASDNENDYNGPNAYPESYGVSKNEFWDWRNLIIAREAEDVAITGQGEIDGNGRDIFDVCRKCEGFRAYIWSYGFALQKYLPKTRPGPLVVFVCSENIRISDITINHAPGFCLLFQGCENVQIRGYRCFNERFHANTDGIHIDTCRNVTVSDCIIDTGDDAIAMRCDSSRLTNGLSSCENITITNCILSSSSSVIRFFGYKGEGHIRNVTISNVVINRGAKAINLVTSYIPEGRAFIEDIYINNVVAKNVSFPFYIRQANGGLIKNVRFSGYRASSFAGAFMIAADEGRIQNVTLRDITVDVIPTPFLATADDLQADCKYLRAKNGRSLFYLSGAKDVKFQNLTAAIPPSLAPNWDGEFYIENCENIEN